MEKAKIALLAASQLCANDPSSNGDTVIKIANKFLKWLDDNINGRSNGGETDATNLL